MEGFRSRWRMEWEWSRERAQLRWAAAVQI